MMVAKMSSKGSLATSKVLSSKVSKSSSSKSSDRMLLHSLIVSHINSSLSPEVAAIFAKKLNVGTNQIPKGVPSLQEVVEHYNRTTQKNKAVLNEIKDKKSKDSKFKDTNKEWKKKQSSVKKRKGDQTFVEQSNDLKKTKETKSRSDILENDENMTNGNDKSDESPLNEPFLPFMDPSRREALLREISRESNSPSNGFKGGKGIDRGYLQNKKAHGAAVQRQRRFGSRAEREGGKRGGRSFNRDRGNRGRNNKMDTNSSNFQPLGVKGSGLGSGVSSRGRKR